MASQIPSLSELSQYNVNVAGQIEGLKWSLYDTLSYAQPGQTQLQFFQQPRGQGGKTLAQTNMTAAGALPAPQCFLINTIELFFFPGEVISTHGAAQASTFINDTYSFYSTPAWLELYIGSKAYLDESPLFKFPPRNGLSGFAAASDTTTAAASGQTLVGYGSAGGPVYELNPPILLTATQNFNVTLNWNAAQSITAAASVVCNLGGVLYRNSQ